MKIKTRPFQISNEMQNLIQEAYNIFTRPLGNYITDVCTDCCISAENEKLLIKTPVKELSRELIYEYLDGAFTDSQSNEIAHFLPRILELLAYNEYIRHSVEITLDKCYFEKNHWNERQLDFMYRYSIQFIKEKLLKPPYENHLDSAMSYILMFDKSGLSTEHLLILWENIAQENETALEHFEYFMYYETQYYEFYNNPFSDNSEFNTKINDWIKNPQTAKLFLPLIENYFIEKYEDEIMKYRFEILYNILENRVK